MVSIDTVEDDVGMDGRDTVQSLGNTKSQSHIATDSETIWGIVMTWDWEIKVTLIADTIERLRIVYIVYIGYAFLGISRTV